MKKVLLSILSVAALSSMNAQTTVFTASAAADFQNFAIVDADQDGKAWGLYDLSQGPAGTTFDAQGEIVGSNSWDTVALTPDNWLITPAIDLTGMTSCSLDFGRAAVDASWPAENYSVYAVSAADVNAAVTAFATATPLLTETIATGDDWQVKTVDLSSMDNTANVYVAIRHYNCTDQYILMVDDITISGTGTPVSITENEATYRTYAYENELYVLSPNATNETVTITSLTGQIVDTYTLNGNVLRTDISHLSSGVYLVTINGNTTKIAVK